MENELGDTESKKGLQLLVEVRSGARPWSERLSSVTELRGQSVGGIIPVDMWILKSARVKTRIVVS